MRKAIFSLLVLTVLAACSGQSEPAADLGTTNPSATLLPTGTFTPSPTATPSPTYTPSSTLTNTPTVTPTPTPKGFYENYGAAFSLIVPKGWEVSQEDSSGTILTEEDLGLSFYAISEVPEEEISFEETVDRFLVEFGEDATLDETDEVTVGDDLTAQRAKITIVNGVIDIRFHLLYFIKDIRTYTFMAIGPALTFDSRSSVFENLYASVTTLTGQVYGLDRDKTLVLMGYDPKPESMDPAISESPPTSYLGLLYSGLVRISPQLHIEPDLAERWAINEDGTVYTFTLREGITFQSGRPITAGDVKYSLERAADPDNDSPTGGTYLGDILGFKTRMEGETGA